MSLVMMEGFDWCRNQDDLLLKNSATKGWRYAAWRRGSVFVPSRTGVSGMALGILSDYTLGTGTTQNDSGVAPGAQIPTGTSTGLDHLNYTTGVTVNQAWQAGGMCMGASASFYQYSDISGGAFAYDQAHQVYIRPTAAGYVEYSSDLMNWQTCLTRMPYASGANNGLLYLSTLADGTWVATATSGATSVTVCLIYYSKDFGTSWTTVTGVTQASGNSTARVYDSGDTTGNYPHVVVANPSGTARAIWVGNLFTNTFTKVLTTTFTVNTTATSQIINGYFLCIIGYQIWSCPTNSLANASSWVGVTSQSTNTIYDFRFFPGGNCWVFCGNNSNYVMENPGTVSAPLPPNGSITRTLNYINATSHGIIFNAVSVSLDGTKCAVYGGTSQYGQYLTSTDGTNWTGATTNFLTPTNGNALPGFTYNGTTYTGGTSIYISNAIQIPDGSVVILFNTPNIRQGFAKSPDGVYNWKIMSGYVAETGAGGSYNGLGFTSCTTGAVPQGATWAAGTAQAIWNTSYGAASTNIPSATAVTALASVTRGTNAYVASFQYGTGTHYYEVLCTADTANPNQFFVSFLLDGTVLYTTPSSILFGASATDTVSHLVITLPRTPRLDCIDDMYMTLQDGNGTVGPLGNVNIQYLQPVSDVSKQWTQVGGTFASNAVAQQGSPMNAPGAVTSNVVGNTDTYNTSGGISSLFTIKAASAETFVKKNTLLSPSVSVQLTSGSTTVESGATTITNGDTYQSVTVIAEKDPATNATWTAAGINAATLSVKQTG